MANFKTRIKQKNDSTANWNTANTEGFRPLQGEIIVYNDVNRIKIGDGSNTVSNVPFLDANCVHLTGTETIDGYKTFKNHITINGSISNSDIMLSATDAANNPGMAGEIAWHDGEGNDGAVYIPQGQGDTLAMCYEIPDKHFTSFGVGDDLSGQILYFNTSIGYSDNYFQAVKTIAESSGGYTIAIGGPPNITLSKNGAIITTFYDFGSNKWLKSSYTLPSDFGTVTTFNDAHGSAKDSIFYTLGLAPIYEYTKLDVGDVYKKIPAVIDSTDSTSSTNALSAFQGNQLKILVNGKAPENHASSATTYGVGTASNYGHVKVISGDLNNKTAQDGYAASQSHSHSNYATQSNPSFSGNALIGGNLTVNGTATFQNEIRVNSSAGAPGQVLMSQGVGNSPQWKDVPVPSNMVTTDTEQRINDSKTFEKNITFEGRSADTYLFDCYANDGQSDTIVGVFLNTIDSTDGKSKGELKLGDGSAECAISLKNSYGTSGQVLTSQGSGQTPIWKTFTASAPSNMVTTDSIQVIAGRKSFEGGLSTRNAWAFFGNTGTTESPNYIIKCYEDTGTNDTLFAVKASGVNKGEVLFGEGAADVNISFGSHTYISSDITLSATLNSYPQTIIQKTGIVLLTSPTAVTTYGPNSITRVSGNNGYTISLPLSNGTLALTNQIPIKTATLSGTTLSITLE